MVRGHPGRGRGHRGRGRGHGHGHGHGASRSPRAAVDAARVRARSPSVAVTGAAVGVTEGLGRGHGATVTVTVTVTERGGPERRGRRGAGAGTERRGHGASRSRSIAVDATAGTGYRQTAHTVPYCGPVSFEPSDAAAFATFVRAHGRGVVATVAASGAPEAALVGIAALDDGTLIFDTTDDSRKVHNLRRDNRVAVVIGTTGDVSVQIEGVATIATGAARERHGAAYNAQFPGSRALDPGFAVIVVRPDWVRVYDASTHPAVVTEARW